jgi:hypothetical protein
MAMTSSTQDSNNVPTLAGRVLGLLASGTAYSPHELALAPCRTRELWEIINAFDALPALTVRCRECGRRIAKWELDRKTCIVNAVNRNLKTHERDLAPFIRKANQDSVAVTARNTRDGIRRHNCVCKFSHAEISLTAEARLRLYIGAIKNPHREVWI